MTEVRTRPGSVTGGFTVLAAVMVLALPVQWMRDDPLWLAVLLVALVSVSVAAAVTRDGPELRTVVVMLAVTVPVIGFGPSVWPLPLLLAVLLLWMVPRFLPSTRPAMTWLRVGRMTRDLPWLTLATVAVSGAALAVWGLWAEPDPGEYLGGLRDRTVAVAILGIAAFSLFNAACEELVFRGAIQTELTTVLGVWPAVVVQAFAFGLLHMTGFPSGASGVALTTIYGLFVGVLRVRSRGLLAPYIAHVLADVTIGVLVVAVL